jgi:hypothetical protein
MLGAPTNLLQEMMEGCCQPGIGPPVICSQALPAIGRTMRPKKAWFSPEDALTASIAPVRYLFTTWARVLGS